MAEPNTLNPFAGTQGWRQLFTCKAEMLHAFDRAKVHSRAHEVETYHGIVAESHFRNWLSEFLAATSRTRLARNCTDWYQPPKGGPVDVGRIFIPDADRPLVHRQPLLYRPAG